MRRKLVINLVLARMFFSLLLNTQAAAVDARGTSSPESSDGKAVLSDSKETPPVVQSGCIAPNDTEFRIGMPGWMAGLSGQFGVLHTVTEPDVDFTKILDHLDMIASGSLYARYHRWEFSADGLYLKLSDTADLRGVLFDSARVSIKQAFAEWFVGYRLISCEAGFLSVSAGGRYNYMSGSFRLHSALAAGRHVQDEGSWVDPALGVSGRVRVWKPVSLWAKGDVGGFGAASDFTWQVQGGVEIRVTRSIYTDLGWRYLKYD